MSSHSVVLRDTEAKPLRPESSSDDASNGITQELDGYSYTVNPSRLTTPTHPTTLVTDASWNKGLRLAAAVILSPLLITGSVLYTGLMYVSPERVQHWFMSRILSRICTVLDSKFATERKTLLAHVSGTVLDLGSGSGAYLKYLAKAKRVVALEPMADLHDTIREQADKYLVETEFSLSHLTLESYLEHNPQEVGTIDWIILGNVMCEVPNPHFTLQAVDRSLKLGGKMYFSEHIACCRTRAPWKRSIQNMFNPFWKVMSGGCNMNRDTLQWIQNMPGWNVIAWELPQMSVGLGPFVLGLVQKQSD